MKKSQKGFIVPLLIAIIAVLVVGGGVYLYTQNKPTTIDTPVPTNVQATSTVQNSTVLNTAKNNQYLEKCDAITDNEAKVNCYIDYAKNKGDVAVCDILGDATLKGGSAPVSPKGICYMNIAVQKNDSSICNEIKDTMLDSLGRNIKEVCLANIKESTSTSSKTVSTVTKNNSSDSTSPVVKITSPLGTKTVNRGDKVVVSWSTTSTHPISVSILGYTGEFIIANNLTNQTSFSWSANKDIQGNVIPSGEYELIISANASPWVGDQTDGPQPVIVIN